MPPVPTQKPSRTCDNCRKRKIRCIENEVDPHREPCVGCRGLMIECTYDYVKKKPGRKNTFAMTVRAEQAAKRAIDGQSPYSSHQSSFSPPMSSSRDTFHHQSMGPPTTSPNHIRSNSYSQSSKDDIFLPQPTSSSTADSSTYNSNTSFSSFSFQPTPARANGNGTDSNGTTGISWLDSMLDPSSSSSLNLGSGGLGNGFGDFVFDDMGFGQFPSEQAQLLTLESPPNLLAPGMGVMNTNGMNRVLPNGPSPSASDHRRNSSSGRNGLGSGESREPQLEDVASWSNISHYLSLFLQYLYPILPLVHRPTFASNLATRLDLRDTDFRALLLSIVACTISQLPTSRLLNEHYDIEGLKRLQRRCHRTSQALQRSYHGTINLTQICIIIFDNFYLVSIGLSHTAGARLGVAVQLAFSLGLQSDSRTEALGLDFVEVQLRRRVFWQLYCSDKTRAIPGHPMLINDFQGVCSYPEPIDDEYITTQGIFQQPKTRTSLLAGFISVCQMFKIISESFFHHRCITTMSFGTRNIGVEWTVEAEDRIHRVLREMPGAIRESESVLSEALRQVFGMQRANILITAAIAKFALYDLRAALDVDEEQLGRDRETIAREIHSLLTAIPVEDLASNGESVRAKVFHIACALCSQVPANDADQELIKDWCNMFSAITFVQMPPPPPDVAADSRANSPPPTNEPDSAISV